MLIKACGLFLLADKSKQKKQSQKGYAIKGSGIFYLRIEKGRAERSLHFAKVIERTKKE